MKKSSTLFLKVVVCIIGIAVLALCFLFTKELIKDGGELFLPILIIIYMSVIPFFFALYQSIKLLSYIDKNIAFSKKSIKALSSIKYSAIMISIVYLVAMPFLFSIADKDDAPGIVAFGLIFIFASIVVTTFAAILQRLLQNGLDMKLENDLTV